MAGIKNDGKDAESQIVEVLDSLSNSNKMFAYHRFPDTRSASRGGRIHSIAAQPSDYMVSIRHKDPERGSRNFFLEVKDTAEERRLPLSKLRQYGMLKKFWWAGTKPFVVIRRSKFNTWCVLTEDRLFPGQSPYVFTDSDPIKSFVIDDLFQYPSAEAVILEISAFSFM